MDNVRSGDRQRDVDGRSVVASFITVSLDGFFEGVDGAFDYFVVDEEFEQFSVEQLDAAGTLVFGRVTFEGMQDYWPSAEAARTSPEIAQRMNDKPKAVASATLQNASWEATVVSRDVARALTAFTTARAGDVLILGSPTLTAHLITLGLLDELRVMISPVVIGQGRSLLESLPERSSLHLLDVRRFESGNVLLTYEPSSAHSGSALPRA